MKLADDDCALSHLSLFCQGSVSRPNGPRISMESPITLENTPHLSFCPVESNVCQKVFYRKPGQIHESNTGCRVVSDLTLRIHLGHKYWQLCSFQAFLFSSKKLLTSPYLILGKASILNTYGIFPHGETCTHAAMSSPPNLLCTALSFPYA